jgi:hypothetical protein
MKRRLVHFLLGIFLLGGGDVFAAVWQWSAVADSITLPAGNHPQAFLWIPEGCPRVRAVVFAHNNMLEEVILEHPRFRQELARLGIAELLVTPLFDFWQVTTNNEGVNAKFTALLKTFAVESGYRELEFAPVIPLGHSASATMPWNFAAWNPQRTVAVLSVHGDAPQTRLTGNSRTNADWGGRNIDGIPSLMVMGEFEWWEDRLAPMFPFKKKHQAAPVALLCDAGNGHFNSSDELVDFLAMFVRKAAEWRLPEKSPLNEPPKLTPVDPCQGWLVDRWRPGQPPAAPAAPFEKYAGNRDEAFWCFDREMARVTEKYYARQRGKLPQLVGFAQDGKNISVTPKSSDQVRLPVPPMDDRLTFHLQGTFLDAVPAGNPEKWTGLTHGTPIGHATGGGPVVLARITGPVEQLSADTFAIRFNRLSILSDPRMTGICLFAKHPGDARYKAAVEPALMRIPARLTNGVEQKISFPKIPDQKAGTKSLGLSAVSSAGVPVYYYVRQGPAEISGDRLVFSKIPPRATFPVKVTVVAWQYGRTIEPKLQSAAPVEQSFWIVSD